MVIMAAKRTQHCTFCKNHGLSKPKKGHQCPYADCPCLLCKLTKKAQVAMRHQQRVWRHQKQKLKIQGGTEDDSSAGEKLSKGQACDKCRNHNIIKPKRNHECPYLDCECEYCSLTFKRREIMKHQQRVRRSKIMSQVESDEKESTEKESSSRDDEDEATENDTDNNSKDSTDYKEFNNVSADCIEPREAVSASSSPVHLLPLPGINQSKELDSLSAQFSSLEALETNCLINPEPNLEPIKKETYSDLGASGCNMSNHSPPPLLPLDSDKPHSEEDYLYRNTALSPPALYEISPSDRNSLENNPYKDTTSYPHGFQMLESSQISTFMLLQSERYLSEPSVRVYSTPRQAQQPSNALKVSMDQSYVNATVDLPLQTCENRFNHSTVSASFSNFTQTPTRILQQREYESQHPYHPQQFQRQHHRNQYRAQPQRDQEPSYSLPYFHQSHLSS